MLFVYKLSGLIKIGAEGEFQPNMTEKSQTSTKHGGAGARLRQEPRVPYCVCGQKKMCSCKNGAVHGSGWGFGVFFNEY